MYTISRETVGHGQLLPLKAIRDVYRRQQYHGSDEVGNDGVEFSLVLVRQGAPKVSGCNEA